MSELLPEAMPCLPGSASLDAAAPDVSGALLNVRMVHGMIGGVATALRGVSRQVDVLAASARESHGTATGLARDMDALASELARIAKWVTHVETIALQTKILAVNAKIEAVHSGESGRGFAIVATAVGDLARESAGAANEIAAAVEAISRAAARTRAGERALGAALTTVQAQALAASASLVEQTEITDAVVGYAGEAATALEQIEASVASAATRFGGNPD